MKSISWGSPSKPTETGINRNKWTFWIIKSSEPLKIFKNQLRPLVRPGSVNLKSISWDSPFKYRYSTFFYVDWCMFLFYPYRIKTLTIYRKLLQQPWFKKNISSSLWKYLEVWATVRNFGSGSERQFNIGSSFPAPHQRLWSEETWVCISVQQKAQIRKYRSATYGTVFTPHTVFFQAILQLPSLLRDSLPPATMTEPWTLTTRSTMTRGTTEPWILTTRSTTIRRARSSSRRQSSPASTMIKYRGTPRPGSFKFI